MCQALLLVLHMTYLIEFPVTSTTVILALQLRTLRSRRMSEWWAWVWSPGAPAVDQGLANCGLGAKSAPPIFVN